MRVHHLNCASMHPVGGPLMRNRLAPRQRALMVCHCLLVETPSSGLVLIDTGFGTDDCARPLERMGRGLLLAGRPVLKPEETALHQVRALGFDPADVRHLVVTHLDVDHAGGLSDFPEARVHLMAREHQAAHLRATLLDRQRYRPVMWGHEPRWATYRPGGERWFGFEAVRDLQGLPPEVLLIPLSGHTLGHAAVAVDTGDGGWLLHCGDAYFHRSAVDPTAPGAPMGLRIFERSVATDLRAVRRNHERLRSLARRRVGDLRIFCAHDPVEMELLVGRSLG